MSLIIKSCIECPFSKEFNCNLNKMWCEIEKQHVKVDMSECKIFEPEDLSQYNHNDLHKDKIDVEKLEITTELTANNISNIFMKNGISPRFIMLDFTYNMLDITLMISPKDIFLLDKASKDIAKTLGIECVIRPRIAPYHVFDFNSYNEENNKKLKEVWSENKECETFFYKSGLNAEQMIKVADLLHAIQNNYCIGAKCLKYKEGEICELYSDGYCMKEKKKIESLNEDSLEIDVIKF